jgi:hypothetical protein
MRSAAVSNWSKAVSVIRGIYHLEGESVSVLGDGFVVANPNRTTYETVTITNGVATLDKCYSVVHIGLPITSDLETLDIDTAQGESMADKKIKIGKVTAHVDSTRGLFVGPDLPETDSSLENMYEFKVRESEGYEDPVSLATGKQDIIIQAHWNSNGRVAFRQTDPLPATIQAILPEGMFPARG